MGWERRRGARYFYRHVRVGGRPRRDYYGRGPAAELAARLMAEARLAREADAAALRDRARALGPVDRALDELDAPCRRLIEAALGAAGYARRHYEWKRIHDRDERTTPA
jgi:hypothetical protein